MGQRSSPKEVVLAVEEELERLAANSEDLDVDEKESSFVERVVKLVNLCGAGGQILLI